MSIDKDQLWTRFTERFDAYSDHVLSLDKPAKPLTPGRSWVKFAVELGDRSQWTRGVTPQWLQLGGLIITVGVPKALGISGGDDLIQIADELFTAWRSPDLALDIKGSARKYRETDTEYQHIIRYRFQSLRPR